MRTSLPIVLLAVAFSVACSRPSRRITGTTPIPKFKDASTVQDTGVIPGCEGNPAGCVPNQLLNQDCSCRPECNPGYIWNGLGCIVDQIADAGTIDTGSPVDTGVVPDSGTPDTGTPPDSGVPPTGCMTDVDCGGGDNVCVDDTNLLYCNGAAQCSCAMRCDPYSTTNTCGASVCTWLGTDPGGPLGLCFADQGGALHGQTCNRQYDANGDVTSDSCNRTRNHLCFGASPMNPVGVCTTICGLGTNQCGQLGNYVCDDLGDSSFGYGFCLEPAPNYTDMGESCTGAAECQGNVCDPTLANSCSANCGGLSTCPANSYCLNLPSGSVCGAGCTIGDDTSCSIRNPDTVCEDLGSTMPIGICIPACVDDTQCNGGTCSNGHCLWGRARPARIS